MAKKMVSVTAQKILKNGKLGKSTKSFDSVKEASEWAVKQGLTDKVVNAMYNIGVTLRNDDHGFNRKQAYGYVWTRG